MVKRAILSVSDKTGIVELARRLADQGVTLLSTGGTMKAIEQAGISVTGVSDVTGFPECLDGRVKTLHPAIHAGLLAVRENPEHMKQLEQLGVEPIDMVVINLYPFRATIEKPGVTFDEAIENIDIGGPTMLRAAAKNAQDVVVVIDPADYDRVLTELETTGDVSLKTKRYLQYKVFEHTAQYDCMIQQYLRSQLEDAPEFPQNLTVTFEKVQEMRYGENPHQSAAFFRVVDYPNAATSLAYAQQLQGKELSYNNYLDLDAAWTAVREYDKPACVIVKHLTPCGVAVDTDVVSAYVRAHEADPVSAYGGVIAFNRPINAEVVVKIFDNKQFVEAIIAPEFSLDAVDMYTAKPNTRLLQTGGVNPAGQTVEYRSVEGGLLCQESDAVAEEADTFTVATKRVPTEEEMKDLIFAWKAVKSVKSNAILIAKDEVNVGVGGGQPNRVNSARIAVEQAGDKAKGAVAASDAFFPFRDGLDTLAEAGVTAIIQPGGSIRDEEVIEAANEHGIAMVFTGHRHFRH